jgi:protease-4
MQKYYLSFFLSLIFVSSTFSQENFPSYFLQNDMEFATTGTMLFGLAGYTNPAELTMQPQPSFYFTWRDKENDFKNFTDWGIFASLPNFGFAANNQTSQTHSVTDYKISTAIGSSAFSFGAGYGWSSGNTDYFDRTDIFTLGTIFRPFDFLSLSVVGNLPSNNQKEAIVGGGIRPFQNYRVTFFGDYVFTEDETLGRIKWSAGASLEPIDGLRFIGRYFEGQSFNVGVQLGLGGLGFTSISHFDEDAKQTYNTYGIRIGANDRNFLNVFSGNNNYVKMDLMGGLKYQTFRIFDDSKTLLNLLEQIEAAKNDNSVTGIAINISGMNINREMLWEVREKLRELKLSGKKIYVYADRIGMDEYHFASVADKIILDPMGSISLNGYLMGRTFYKGSLDKIGIGFHELRYFKYKSAVESYSREDFSEADREQRQRLVDENYYLAQKEICASRKFTFEYFDQLVDSTYLYLPEDAVKIKLVDTLARWSDIGSIIKKYEQEDKNLISTNSLEEFTNPDDYWGSKPKIAVIYAIGGTSMDDGIKARTLVKYVEAAINSNSVKAIILRVDSPGGDALAADLIADVLRKEKGKKPIIVSQGYVAASGGYWLSMYADTIIAAPNTITGSIGVISAFYFNKDLKQQLGLSYDYVKKGKFADLGYGVSLPLVGLSIPDRDFTDKELSIAETGIKTLYKDFVNKVALGRKKSFYEIEKIAQGRVWSGSDGLRNGLVDKLGGLDEAIKIALEKTDLTNSEYEIIEMPEREWFDFNALLPSFLRIENTISEDPFIKDLKFRLKNNAVPMPILPTDFIDENMMKAE